MIVSFGVQEFLVMSNLRTEGRKETGPSSVFLLDLLDIGYWVVAFSLSLVRMSYCLFASLSLSPFTQRGFVLLVIYLLLVARED